MNYEFRRDIHDRAALERNIREKFEKLNRVKLSDRKFSRLPEEIICADVYDASCTLRERNTFMCDNGTPFNSTLVNIKDWCKNHYEVVY